MNVPCLEYGGQLSHREADNPEQLVGDATGIIALIYRSASASTHVYGHRRFCRFGTRTVRFAMMAAQIFNAVLAVFSLVAGWLFEEQLFYEHCATAAGHHLGYWVRLDQLDNVESLLSRSPSAMRCRHRSQNRFMWPSFVR